MRIIYYSQYSTRTSHKQTAVQPSIYIHKIRARKRFKYNRRRFYKFLRKCVVVSQPTNVTRTPKICIYDSQIQLYNIHSQFHMHRGKTKCDVSKNLLLYLCSMLMLSVCMYVWYVLEFNKQRAQYNFSLPVEICSNVERNYAQRVDRIALCCEAHELKREIIF